MSNFVEQQMMYIACFMIGNDVCKSATANVFDMLCVTKNDVRHIVCNRKC